MNINTAPILFSGLCIALEALVEYVLDSVSAGIGNAVA